MEIFAVLFKVTCHLLPAEPEGELHEPEIVKVYGQAEEFYLQDFFLCLLLALRSFLLPCLWRADKLGCWWFCQAVRSPVFLRILMFV